MNKKIVGGILQAAGIMIGGGLGGFCALLGIAAYPGLGITLPTVFVASYIGIGILLFLWGRNMERTARRNSNERDKR